jgi:purine-nucleoside phosphorylase
LNCWRQQIQIKKKLRQVAANNNSTEVSLYDSIQTAVGYIRQKGYNGTPDAALIFGSGLGEIAYEMGLDREIPYEDIPGFVSTTLEFHRGRMLFGQISGVEIVAMDGRFHYYEGYSMQDITFPVRVMKALGAKKLLLSNISGGLNPGFVAGDIVLISDHINMMGGNPLIGRNDERLGARFPDMIEPYSKRLGRLAEQYAMRSELILHSGVYLALTGPCFETRAEYRMLRSLGADLVGMSSVPEVIVAVHAGLEVLGLSLVSDECFPDCLQPVEIELLLKRASVGSKIIAGLFQSVLKDPDF